MDIARVIKGTTEYQAAYQIALEWWKFWKFQAPPAEFLPTNMICVYTGQELVAISFLYATDGGIAWMEWTVGNPKSSKQNRAEAQEIIIDTAKHLAMALGFKAVFTSSKNPVWNKKLERKFKKTDECMTHFVWRA